MLLRRRATVLAAVAFAVLAVSALTAAPSAVAVSPPARAHVAAATASPSPAEHKKDDGGSPSTSTWLIVSIFFVASVGVGFLLSGRKGRRQR